MGNQCHERNYKFCVFVVTYIDQYDGLLLQCKLHVLFISPLSCMMYIIIGTV